MKQKLSILSLVSSHTLKSVILICFLMASLQIGLLYYLGEKQVELVNYNSNIQPFYAWGEQSLMKSSYMLGLSAILAVCIIEYSIRHGKYTLLRLNTEKSTFFLACFTNTLCSLLILWAVETVVLICGSYYYIFVTNPDFITNQSTFLSTFYNNFLQVTFPTVNFSVWVKNIFQILLLSATVGKVSTNLLQDKPWKLMISILIFLVFNYFTSRETLSNHVFSVIYAVFLLLFMKGGLFCEKENTEL